MRDNYNAITPIRRKFIVVMGTDEFGWAVYDIDAYSEAEAKLTAERHEIRRRNLFSSEKRDGYVSSASDLPERPRSDNP